MARIALAAAAVGLALFGSAANAAAVFQSVDLALPPDEYLGSAFGIGQQSVGEAFALPSSASIASVDFTVAANNPTLASVLGYSWPSPVTIGIYENDSAIDGVTTQIYSETISTFVSDQHLGFKFLSGAELIHADLSTTVDLPAGSYLVFLTGSPGELAVYGFGGARQAVVISPSAAQNADLSGDGYYNADDDIGVALCPDQNACVGAGTIGGGGVPEPAGWVMMLVGVSALGSAVRVRRATAPRPATLPC